MRITTLLPAILAASAGFSTAYADTLPVGTYSLSAHTTTSGVHQSLDQGMLSGTITFDAMSQVTAANLVFDDLTDGISFTFTVPGPTEYTPQPHLVSAKISNASSPATTYYYFSISTNPVSGNYNLTCGTDCANDVIVPDATGRSSLNEEVFGNITPAAVTPEPSTLVLLGTGLLAGVATVRRRSMPA